MQFDSVHKKLRVVVLTGQDSPATRAAVSMLLQLPKVEFLAVLVDAQPLSFKARMRNLRRNTRRDGLPYVMFRIGEYFQDFIEVPASRLVLREEVQGLLRRAFPEIALTLAEFGRQENFVVQEVGNLNRPPAAEVLRNLDPDLGVVLGTRILKHSTFTIPRMGCINLHKGKVPEYRGMPPGFWELYDGQDSAGVTVHVVDDGLDTGDVLGTRCIPIHPKDTPVTLRKKLDQIGNELLACCVADLAEGKAICQRQPPSKLGARTSPTLMRARVVVERLGPTVFLAWTFA